MTTSLTAPAPGVEPLIALQREPPDAPPPSRAAPARDRTTPARAQPRRAEHPAPGAVVAPVLVGAPAATGAAVAAGAAEAPTPAEVPSAAEAPTTGGAVEVPTTVGAPATPPTVAEAKALAMNLARCVVEILAGTREIDQIARWLSTDVYTHLLKRVVISSRARTARGETPGRLAFTMGSTVVCEPTPGVVEAVVIVHGRARSRAVALRLEQLETRWRASAVHVL